MLIGLRIEGPGEVAEESLTLYTVIAEFDNGWEFDVTLDCSLWLEPGTNAEIGVFGDLDAFGVDADQVETIHAFYSFGSDSEMASLDVTIHDLPPAKYALHFDGSNDSVSIPRQPHLEPEDAMSVECWIKPRLGSERHAVLVRKGQEGSSFILRWHFNADQHIRLHIVKTGAPTINLVDPTSNADYLDEWHHIAATYSASEDYARLYVDGALVAEDSGFGTLLHTPGDLWIGDTLIRSDENYSGQIDEVRVWSVARTQCDIRHNMNRKLRGDELGLIGWWRFDEGSGQTVSDSSSFGNDGYLGRNDDPGGDSADPLWIESQAGLTLPALPGPTPGGPTTDLDDDCDVDGDDLDLFEACASGPAIPVIAGCEDRDFDLDNDTDQSDFGIFQRCYSGPVELADPTCAD